MAKLESNPQVAAEFAAATPGKSRREAVEACHQLAVATLAEVAANKTKLAAARAKIAALEAAKKSQPTPSMHTTPSPTKAPTVTAAAFATAPLAMTRSEFSKLSPADKMRFFKTGGKLV
jgi:hypothetical protein